MTRLVLALVFAILLAAGLAAPSGVAAKPGSAKDACKKGGHLDLYRADGTPFADQGECVNYVVEGGVLSSTPLSRGCSALNDPTFDGLSVGDAIRVQQFLTGEVVTVSGSRPTTGGADAFLFLYTPSSLIFPIEVLLPGSTSFTVSADELYDVVWSAYLPGSQVTFTVSCAR